jgi:hypothetical protein
MFLGFSGVFSPSSLSHVLVPSLYISCMLRGAFYVFIKFSTYKKKIDVEDII